MRKVKTKNNKLVFIIAIMFMIVFSMETFGYALYGRVLNIDGELLVKKVDSVMISNFTKVDEVGINTSLVDTVRTTLNYDISFNENGSISYLVDISNDTALEYEFVDIINTLSVGNSDDLKIQVSGINIGDKLAPGKNVTATIKLDSNVSQEVIGNLKLVFVSENNGSLTSTLITTTGDLRNDNIIPVTINILNTYSYYKEVSLSINNPNFKIVNSDYSEYPVQRVNANDTTSITFYLTRSDTALFQNNQENVSITVNSNGIPSMVAGTINISVTKDKVGNRDTQAPQISNVTVSQGNTEGTATVSWTATDSSSIRYYKIYVVQNNTTKQELRTNSDETTISVNNLTDGTYQFKVVGEDVLGNTATTQNINQCSTNRGACSMANNVSLKWTYTVTNNASNCTYTGNTSIKRGETYTVTYKANNRYELPNTITVTMGGTTLRSGTGYTWNANTGVLTINNVTGDLTIRVSATSTGCLIKGTKVRLANNNEKNIEDITYHDLLAVWDYENGGLTYEYPIWIEKENKTDVYQKITLSNGSVLKTYGYHGVFNMDTNLFISVDDPDFKEGIHIAVIDGNKIKKVTVKKIEEVRENTTYYHVVSTRYYNIIANDILTTDGTVILSNLYGFTNDIKWSDSTKKLYNEHEFDFMPIELREGLRVEEAAKLSKYIDLNTFKTYLKLNQLNDAMYLKPSNIIKVSFENIETSVNYGDEIIIPSNAKCWLNTTNNKYYYPGDKLNIYSGTYFKAIK